MYVASRAFERTILYSLELGLYIIVRGGIMCCNGYLYHRSRGTLVRNNSIVAAASRRCAGTVMKGLWSMCSSSFFLFFFCCEVGDNSFSHENFHEVHTANTEISEVKNKLEKKIENFLSTEIEWVPLNIVNLSGENKDNMIKFLENLDDDEDVQNIFTNAKFEN